MKINIVFDGPPGPEPGRFVEAETLDGKSVRVGKWFRHPRLPFARLDWWVLQLEVPDDTVQR